MFSQRNSQDWQMDNSRSQDTVFGFEHRLNRLSEAGEMLYKAAMAKMPEPAFKMAEFELDSMGNLDVKDDYHNFTIKTRLGRGAYGTVYKALDHRRQQYVALKLYAHQNDDSQLSPSIIRETALMSQLDHPNILKLFQLTGNSSKFYMVLELMDCDLRQYLDTPDYSGQMQTVIPLLRQVLGGLEYCHARRIIHRDLKPQNILMQLATMQVKISDFGLARKLEVPVRSYSPGVVTVYYRPPEILLGFLIYTEAVDVWSLGCIFAEMLMKTPIFTGTNELSQLQSIFQLLGSPVVKDWPEIAELSLNVLPTTPRDLSTRIPALGQYPKCKDLLKRMLKLNPQKRITSKEALDHSAFKRSPVFT